MMDNIIQQIITNKENGIDCTKIESAEIKMFLKEMFSLLSSMDALIDFDLINKIGLLFPMEYTEAIDEFEKIINEVK